MSDSETKTFSLHTAESAEAFGLRVSFGGAVPVHYASRPTAGSIVLDFTAGSDEERVVWMQDDWSEWHEIFGFGYRVLNAPELAPKEIRIEIRDKK
jgi:hypothetical protein